MTKNLRGRRPNAAMIVAIVALVAALAGTAVAGGGFLTKKAFNKTAVQKLTYVNSTQPVPSTATDTFVTVSAGCPKGLRPVGGGVKLSPDDHDLWWDAGYLTATGYAAKIANNVAPNVTGTAVVTVACVKAKAKGSPAG